MKELIAATNNKAKIREIESILGGFFIVKSLQDVGLDIDPEETGLTFEENAVIKAKAVFDILKKPVISDDSGLEVDILNGEPGVFSARYACHGDDGANNQKLLKNLEDKPNRDAKFVSVVAFIDEKGTITTARGETRGKILKNKKGQNGFGYDPLFYSYVLKKTFAEASPDEKNKISHRYNALKNLLEKLDQRT